MEVASEPLRCFPEVGARAGKTVFPVIVGQDDYLYRSSKSTRQAQIPSRSIDLHGCNREEALDKLNDALPSWMNEAMREFPWTLRVDIITGGGSQILAEAVEHWIREKRNVANRFV
eukprot:CCRYP_017801-RA/>CCRYP_017801-RA protein AED:0.08 eAED:0.05 QI:0/-1/0/1/-1/0/1/0/115